MRIQWIIRLEGKRSRENDEVPVKIYPERPYQRIFYDFSE